MDAVVMCGGEGRRLGSPHEKPLYPIAGVPMIDRVLDALAGSRVETIYAAVSPNAPETRAHLETARDCPILETAGEGYVTDLQTVLKRPALSRPLLTVAADLPLLEPVVIDRILMRYGDRETSATVCVPVALKRDLGVTTETTLEGATHLAPTGVNVVGTTEAMTQVSFDTRLAVNVNRNKDAAVATRLA